MVAIFILSSQYSIQVSKDTTEDFIVHKLAHILEYGLLTFLFFRAFYLSFGKSLTLKQHLFMAALCTLIYAATDEVHQLFVPTRTGRFIDVLIDGIGISLVVLYTKYQFHKVKKILF
jgi:VanZ family protein